MKDESQPILTKERNFLVFWEDVKPNGTQDGLFNTVLMMRVSVPGDQSNVEYWVDETYPEGHPHPIFGKSRQNELVYKRFGEYIKAYKENNAAIIQAGIPLETCPFLSRAQIAMLRYQGIHNAEALAGINDEQISRLGPGGRELVKKAANYVQASTDSAANIKADAEKKELQSRLEALELKYTEIMGIVSELPEDAKALIKAQMKKNQEKPKRAA